MGVSHFYIAQHLPSWDNTDRILETWVKKRPYSIHLFPKTGPFLQCSWTAELCNIAIKNARGLPIVIFPLDMDEFVGPNPVCNRKTLRGCVEEIAADLESVESVRRAPWYRKPTMHRTLLVKVPSCVVCSGTMDPKVDWRRASFRWPIATGKEKCALFVGRNADVKVTKGCCHLLLTEPPTPLASCPNMPLAGSDDRYASIPPGIFPFVGEHHRFHTPLSMLHRVRAFCSSKDASLGHMLRGYGMPLGIKTTDKFTNWIFDTKNASETGKALLALDNIRMLRVANEAERRGDTERIMGAPLLKTFYIRRPLPSDKTLPSSKSIEDVIKEQGQLHPMLAKEAEVLYYHTWKLIDPYKLYPKQLLPQG